MHRLHRLADLRQELRRYDRVAPGGNRGRDGDGQGSRPGARILVSDPGLIGDNTGEQA